MHLRHEAELADGEGIGEDNVGGRKECSVEGGALRGPHAPLDAGNAARLGLSLDTRRNDGDEDGNDDGDEVDVSEDRELGETLGRARAKSRIAEMADQARAQTLVSSTIRTQAIVPVKVCPATSSTRSRMNMTAVRL